MTQLQKRLGYKWQNSNYSDLKRAVLDYGQNLPFTLSDSVNICETKSTTLAEGFLKSYGPKFWPDRQLSTIELSYPRDTEEIYDPLVQLFSQVMSAKDPNFQADYSYSDAMDQIDSGIEEVDSSEATIREDRTADDDRDSWDYRVGDYNGLQFTYSFQEVRDGVIMDSFWYPAPHGPIQSFATFKRMLPRAVGAVGVRLTLNGPESSVTGEVYNDGVFDALRARFNSVIEDAAYEAERLQQEFGIHLAVTLLEEEDRPLEIASRWIL